MAVPTAVSTAHILTQSGGALANITKTYRQTRAIDAIFKQYAPANIAKHYQVCLFLDNVLLLTANTQAWTAKLRLLKPELLSQLRQVTAFAGLKRIEAQTKIKTTAPRTTCKQKGSTSSQYTIPAAALEIAKQWAQSTDDPQLQKKLETFIQHHQDTIETPLHDTDKHLSANMTAVVSR